MESIDEKVIKSISKRGRGSVFFSSDFISLGEHKTILKSLERLTQSGKIIRLARGVYYYPKRDKVLGLGVLYPSYDEIAMSIARRDKARITPAGAYAMNILGLTSQIPMNIVFLTDGSPRKIRMFNGHQITFKHTVPKNLSFQDKTAQLITFALKDLGQDNVTDEHKKILRRTLEKIPQNRVSGDYRLMPVWIRTIIKDIYEQLL